MIRKNSPIAFILGAALLIACLNIIVYLVINLLFRNPSDYPYRVCILFVATSLIGAYVFYLTLNNYLNERITPIYKALSRLKKINNSKKRNRTNVISSFNEPILDEIEREVVTWAKDRNKEIQDLRNTEAYRREYVGNVSHELKTPVFNVQGYIYTLLDGGVEDDRICMSYLQKAANNIDRLQNIIQDLEVISTLESSEEELDLKSFSVHNLLEDLRDDFRLSALEKNITVKVVGQDKSLNAWADRSRIHQVLTNLISNSIRYGQQDGVTKLSYFDLDSYLLIEVEDNGIGMDEKHTKRIFERFYRVDKGRSRSLGGTGLGLSIVKHILEKHNQTIEIKSKKGEGTTFSFTLEKSL